MALTKITTSVVAVNSLTAANIADNSIDATKIANNQILARHIAADALSDQIADNSITAGMIPNATALTLDGGVTIDNITIDGTEIDLSSGDLTLDVAASITLDSDSGVIDFDDGGTNIGRFENSSSDFKIESRVQDKDIVFVGNDNGTGVTALTLDMSDAGAATFNHHLIVDTDTLVVDASNDRVGVNTASPSSPLHVTRASSYPIATFTQNGADQYNVIYLQNSNSTASTVCFGTGGGSVGNASWANSAVFGTTADAKVVLLQNDSAAVTIDTDQKVGIGTTSPASALHISGGDNTAAKLTITNTANTNTYSIHAQNNAQTLNFQEDGTTVMSLATGGKLGIGTTSPDTLLNLESAAPTIRLAPTTQNNSSSIELGVLNGGTNAYAKIDVVNVSDYDSNLRFYTNAAGSTTQVERMRILAGGGLTFNGDTAAANALDDYEEGTWTPTVGGWNNSTVKSTASQNQGHYTKVGPLVTVTANVTWDGTETLSGGIIVRGLPYAAKNVAGYRAGGSMAGFTGLAASGSYTYFTLGIDASQTYFYIINANATGYGHSPTVSNSGAVYGLTFSYQTT